MVQVLWTAEALEDRRAIWAFVAADNHKAAAALDLSFETVASHLALHPQMGRPGKIAGTREVFPTRHYRIVYQFNGSLVIIIAVLHTARRWPPASP
jgi:plasmid stabilization system protein ParE